MPQQPTGILENPNQQTNLKRYYAAGTDRKVFVDVPPEMSRDAVAKMLQERYAQTQQKPGLAEQLITGVLPDLGAAAASRLIPGAPNVVKAVMSLLGAGAGEGVRAGIKGEEFDPANVVLPGVGAPAVAAGGRAIAPLGRRFEEQAFKSSPRHEARFPNVNIVDELNKRKATPTKKSVENLKSEQQGLVSERKQEALGKHAPTYEVIDSLLDLRSKVEPSATWGRADLSEIDELIQHIQNMPHSGGTFHVAPGGQVSRNRPAPEMLDAKVFRGMAADPSFTARQSGKLAGENKEIDAAMTHGLADALDIANPRITELSEELMKNKAIRGPLAAAEHRQRTRPGIDPRYMAGAGVAGLTTPWTGGTGAAAGAISLLLGHLASSPKAQVQTGRKLQALGSPRLEDIVRAILAGGDAAITADQAK